MQGIARDHAGQQHDYLGDDENGRGHLRDDAKHLLENLGSGGRLAGGDGDRGHASAPTLLSRMPQAWSPNFFFHSV